MPDEIRVLTNCALGVGFSWRSFQAGLAEKPHLIGADGGTADMGPHDLATDPEGAVSPAVRRDLEIMLLGARENNVPLSIGTSGHAGGEPHLQALFGAVKDIAKKHGLHFRTTLIHTELDTGRLKERLDAGRISPLGHQRELTSDDLDRSERIVGMACGKPFERAWETEPDVVLAGRAADPAIFAPFLMRHQIPPGIAWHAGKTIDKGHNATTDWWQGSSLLARVDKDGFTVSPMKPESRCTVGSVAAMTMYEHVNPHRYLVSEGALDTSKATFEQIDDRSVRVSGAVFDEAERYTVKLEGAARVGYRAVEIGGMRDPILIANLREILANVPDVVDRASRSAGIDPSDYTLRFLPYGLGAVMGDLEPVKDLTSPEVGLVIEAIGTTQEIASTVASKAASLVSHSNYPGKLSRNLAFPFSPTGIEAGPVADWSVWHLLDTADDNIDDLFPIEVCDL